MKKNPLILFSKHYAMLGVEQLIERAHEYGIEGWDLACRPGHTVSPENVKSALPKAAKQFRAAGLDVPMITSHFDLLEPTHPTAEPILGAMQEAGIKLLKIGYFSIDNAKEDYWEKISYIRTQFEGWSRLSEKFGVRVCYHTHSMPKHMGINAAGVMHFINGFDPKHVGVYLDPGHLILDGEHPDAAFSMTKRYLAIIGLKDAIKRTSNINFGYEYIFARAGHGQVDWPCVFENIRRVNFDGPLSLHAEYERYMTPDKNGERPAYFASLRGEVDFFRKMRDGHGVEVRV